MPPPLRIADRSIDGVVVLQLDGQLVADEGDALLRERVTALVAGGARMLVIDLQNVTYIDSGGVGALIAMNVHVMRHGGRLTLLRPSACATRVLQITHLATVFEIFQDEQQAVGSLTPAPIQPGASISCGS